MVANVLKNSVAAVGDVRIDEVELFKRYRHFPLVADLVNREQSDTGSVSCLYVLGMDAYDRSAFFSWRWISWKSRSRRIRSRI